MSLFTAVILINNYIHAFPNCILYIQITKENTRNSFQRTKNLLVKLDSANAFVIICFSFVSGSSIFSVNKYSLIVLSCMRTYNMAHYINWDSLSILSYTDIESYYVYHMVLHARKLPKEKTLSFACGGNTLTCNSEKKQHINIKHGTMSCGSQWLGRKRYTGFNVGRKKKRVKTFPTLGMMLAKS